MDKLELSLAPGKKAYFASDFHLGAPNFEKSLDREKKLVAWLDSIAPDCQYLFLVGDLFDFWFDYHDVVPKGFVRFLGKLADFSDRGVQIFLFTGNHDMWMFGYLEKEIGAKIYREAIEIQFDEYNMVVGHGDGLGPGDHTYKFLKQVFKNKICQWLFAFVHPRIGIGIAKKWSGHSRISNNRDDEFLGEKEFLWIYCKTLEMSKHHDLYLFGHRHLPLDLEVGENSRYINLGEWINHCRFVEFDGKSAKFLSWV
jgi:UDP-2,3-diacylglucosamine hydrolase